MDFGLKAEKPATTHKPTVKTKAISIPVHDELKLDDLLSDMGRKIATTTPSTTTYSTVKTTSGRNLEAPPQYDDFKQYVAKFQKTDSSEIVKKVKSEAFNKCANEIFGKFLDNSGVDAEVEAECRSVTSKLVDAMQSPNNTETVLNLVDSARKGIDDCDSLQSCLLKTVS